MNPSDKNQNDLNKEANLNQKTNNADDQNAGRDTGSTDDASKQRAEERKFHQAHGNRKYESHSNHSSADDQPTVDNGPGTV